MAKKPTATEAFQLLESIAEGVNGLSAVIRRQTEALERQLSIIVRRQTEALERRLPVMIKKQVAEVLGHAEIDMGDIEFELDPRDLRKVLKGIVRQESSHTDTLQNVVEQLQSLIDKLQSVVQALESMEIEVETPEEEELPEVAPMGEPGATEPIPEPAQAITTNMEELF
jgi:rubrerythrin